MRRTGALLSVTTSLALLAACQVTLDYTAEEQAIRDLDAQWVAAIAARDSAGMVSLYAPDAYYLAPGQEALIGRQAIEESIGQELAATAESPGTLTFGPEKIEFSTVGDMAWEYGTWQYVAEGVEEHGKYVVVWKKIEGEWKAVVDIYNSNTPPAM